MTWVEIGDWGYAIGNILCICLNIRDLHIYWALRFAHPNGHCQLEWLGKLYHLKLPFVELNGRHGYCDMECTDQEAGHV